MIEKLKNKTVGFIAEMTLPIRHKIVRNIAPKIYSSAKLNETMYNDIPRPFTLFLKHKYGNKPLVGCEIGVSAGDNAESMMKILNIKRLYLIDSYTKYFQDGKLYDFSMNERIAKERLDKYGDKIIWIKKLSELVDETDISEILDFCYIDGNHEFKYVVSDIAKFKKMTRLLIGGHDYGDSFLGVIQAVAENFKMYSPRFHHQLADWFYELEYFYEP